jgi:hypothetical protein
MSQGASAADAFVPFDPTSASEARVSSLPAGVKVVPKPAAGSDFTPLRVPGVAHAHAASGFAGPPVVTLDREGERVTAIRIECVCGQVIELTCSY